MARAKRREREDEDWPDSAQARKEQAAADELLKRPAEAAMRQAKFGELGNLAEEARQASRDVSEFRKDMSAVYGWHKKSIPLIVSLNKLQPVDRSHVLLDLKQAKKDYGWDQEMGMLERLVDQGGDSGPVFDQTEVAEALPAKRKGRPKGSKNKPKEEPAPTPGMPLEEAEAAFEATKDQAPRLDEGDDESLRPRFLRRRSGESDPDAPEIRGGFKIVG